MAGRTVYYTACSLDGFLADAENSLDWLFEVDSAGAPDDDPFGRFFAGIGAMAMGATTYLWVLEHEQMLEHPERWAGAHGATPCWVFTHRELPAVPGADIRFVRDDVRPVHAAMVEAAGGKDVWLVGGGELVGQFHDAGLLDDLIVQVGSVTLGQGKPLLPRRITSPSLRLVEARRIGEGFAELRYEVRRP